MTASEPIDPAAELLTVRDFLRHAVSSFERAGLVYGHGTTTAFDDAAFLVLEALRLPVDRLEPWLDARLLADERRRLAGLIAERISSRKPTCYLLNKAYIQGMPFYVDERVIVPRSYLGEMLAGEQAEALFGEGEGTLIDAPADVSRILELCTGSGCLAIVAALRFPQATIDAVELDPGAVEVARRNIEDYGLEGRIRLFTGDLYAPLPDGRYDLIIANPPYVAMEVVDAFPPEFAAEPRMAHLGGADGFDLVRRIIDGAAKRLTPSGGLLCEIGEDRALLEEERPELPLLWLDTAESEGEVFWLTGRDLSA
jgi:ribosomal protein L3 glutamine methyltransferase